jgi:urease gamma subunit
MDREPKTLYYIPIIHTSADMGSLAKAVTERGISQIGERNWERHVATIHRFWDRIAEYCASLPAEGMKIYQDGLVAEGEIGTKIISAGAESGSRNYKIVQELMRRGAQIVKTEDFKLVLEERDRILALVQAKNFRAKISAFIKYRFVKHGLLKRRDMFIAQRIAETLGQGGPAPHSPDREAHRDEAGPAPRSHPGAGGILFIGAVHNVKSRLPKDIKVIEIKDAKKVRKYQELLPFSRRRSRRFAELGKYLAAEIVARDA